MQNFSPLALKLRKKIEDDRRTYCKNAKFQTAIYETKILFQVITKLFHDYFSRESSSIRLAGLQFPDLINLLIQGKKKDTLVKIPGWLKLAQPVPRLTIPIKNARELGASSSHR